MALGQDEFEKRIATIQDRTISEAYRLRNEEVESEHIVLALIYLEDLPKGSEPEKWRSEIEDIMAKMGEAIIEPQSEPNIYKPLKELVEIRKLKSALEFIVGEPSSGKSTVSPEISIEVMDIYNSAKQEYDRDQRPHLPINYYVLHAIIKEGNSIAAGVLESVDLTLDKLTSYANKYRPKPT